MIDCVALLVVALHDLVHFDYCRDFEDPLAVGRVARGYPAFGRIVHGGSAVEDKIDCRGVCPEICCLVVGLVEVDPKPADLEVVAFLVTDPKLLV